MRKTMYCLCGGIVVLFSMAALCYAATMAQVAGDYPLLREEKVSIKKIGKGSWSGGCLLTMYPDGTWEDSWFGQGRAAFDAKGKKLTLQFDAVGLANLEAELVDWAYDVAASEGIAASGLNFTFTEMSPVKCKVDKKSNRVAKKLKIKGAGMFSGTLNGTFVTTAFKYQSKAEIM